MSAETCATRLAAALDSAADQGKWAVLPIDLTLSTARSIGNFSIAEHVDQYGVVIKQLAFEDGSTISLLDEEATQKRRDQSSDDAR